MRGVVANIGARERVRGQHSQTQTPLINCLFCPIISKDSRKGVCPKCFSSHCWHKWSSISALEVNKSALCPSTPVLGSGE